MSQCVKECHSIVTEVFYMKWHQSESRWKIARNLLVFIAILRIFIATGWNFIANLMIFIAILKVSSRSRWKIQFSSRIREEFWLSSRDFVKARWKKARPRARGISCNPSLIIELHTYKFNQFQSCMTDWWPMQISSVGVFDGPIKRSARSISIFVLRFS